MKRAIFLATGTLLAMLILVPMTMAQDAERSYGVDRVVLGTDPTTYYTYLTYVKGSQQYSGGGVPTPPTGGPAFLLPAASVLLGSGILTYAILRRRQ